MTGISDHTPPAVLVSADIRSEAAQQVDSLINKTGSNNALPSVHGKNGVNDCSTSVCNDVNCVINQETNQPMTILNS